MLELEIDGSCERPLSYVDCVFFFFFQAEDGIRDLTVTGVQTCALPISVDQHEQLVAEADQLDDVNAEPHHPRYESACLNPKHVRDRGIAADRGQRPLVDRKSVV